MKKQKYHILGVVTKFIYVFVLWAFVAIPFAISNFKHESVQFSDFKPQTEQILSFFYKFQEKCMEANSTVSEGKFYDVEVINNVMKNLELDEYSDFRMNLICDRVLQVTHSGKDHECGTNDDIIGRMTLRKQNYTINIFTRMRRNLEVLYHD